MLPDPIYSAEAPLNGFLDDCPTKLLFIGGNWVPSMTGETLASVDPSSGQVIAHIQAGGSLDVDKAVQAARASLTGEWARLKPYDRQQLLLRLADIVDREFEQLASIEAVDMGNPLVRGRNGRQRVVSMLRFYAGLATAVRGHTIHNSIAGSFFTYTLKEPIGVVGAITPWNSPLSQAVWKLAPALAAGCSVVLKPSEVACLSVIRLAELAQEAGVPPGVLNVVTGAAPAGAALAAHPGVDKIAFTGSTATGQAIIRASAGNVKKVTLELGGKSANIVFDDADVEAAATGAAAAVFTNSGQLCIAGSRLFVQRSIYDEFIERVSRMGSALKVGPALDPQTQIGPLASSAQLDRVLSFIQRGEKDGARLVSGGRQQAQNGLSAGFYVPPTVFGGVTDDMEIAREEIFGPVISALPFDTEEEVIQRANASDYGLGGGVWTRNLATAHRMAGAIRTGTVWVNCYLPMDPAVPFGGMKMSGLGRESGVEHIDEYLVTKSVVMRT